MNDSPDISVIAALIGDRARAAILMALMSGRALTATELARAARVTKQTASAHLAKLLRARLVTVERAGRHHYVRLADHAVAAVLERLSDLALRAGAVHVDPGPPDPALRRARVCYDHLAGDFGVLVFDGLRDRGLLRVAGRKATLTGPGERFCTELGIDLASLSRSRRPLCLTCLDWSARRHHLAGALGAALLARFYTLGWARPHRHSRVVTILPAGERAIRARFAR